MEHLTSTLGMLDENIAEKNFEAIDEDGDGLVSKQESFNAFNAIDRDCNDHFDSNCNDD